jgi:hypothetical protein
MRSSTTIAHEENLPPSRRHSSRETASARPASPCPSRKTAPPPAMLTISMCGRDESTCSMSNEPVGHDFMAVSSCRLASSISGRNCFTRCSNTREKSVTDRRSTTRTPTLRKRHRSSHSPSPHVLTCRRRRFHPRMFASLGVGRRLSRQPRPGQLRCVGNLEPVRIGRASRSRPRAILSSHRRSLASVLPLGRERRCS